MIDPWLEEDAGSLGEWAAAQGPAFVNHNAIPIGLEWAAVDPPAAAAWALTIPGTKARDDTVDLVIIEWAQSDPWAAAEFLAAHPTRSKDLNQRDVLGCVARELAEVDPAATLDWLSGFDPACRDEVAPDIFRIWAERDPAAAGGAVVNLPPGEVRESVLPSFARGFHESDPAAAVNWAGQQSDPDVARAMMGWEGERLGKTDAVAGARWVHGLDPGPGRDRAVSGFASSLQSINPVEALRWAATIDDPDLRSHDVKLAWLSYRAKDHAAAVRELASGDLVPEEDRRELLEAVKRIGGCGER